MVTLVDKFVTHVIAESTFEEMDRIYLTNRVLARWWRWCFGS